RTDAAAAALGGRSARAVRHAKRRTHNRRFAAMVRDLCNREARMTAMPDDSDLDRLCAQWGVQTSYADIWGNRHAASANTKRAILAAMGAFSPGASPSEPADILPVTQVLEHSDGPSELVAVLDAGNGHTPLRWHLQLESGA